MKTCWKECSLLRNFWVNPCPFTCALVVRNVRMIPVSPTIISRLRRRPDFKKWKILDKRWWNMQRQRISHYETGNQCKILCISNTLFVKPCEIAVLGDVSARFTTVCQEFFVFLIRVFSWAEIWWRGYERHAYGLHNRRTRKRPRVDSKIPEYFRFFPARLHMTSYFFSRF